MNSRQTLSVGVLLLAAVPSQLLGGFAIQDWKYFKTLRADTSAYYVRIILDRETFDHARPDVSDLRVLDSAGHEVPYQLIRGSEWHTVEQRGARVLNISHAPGKYSVVVLDVGKSGKAHNVVDLDIASHNYRRNVRLFGSDDARRWFVLRDDVAVFDFSTADDSVRVNRIRYPESIYRYLKIHVMNGSEPPLLVRSATLAVESEPARTLRNYDATTVSVRHDARRKQSTLLIDGGFRNVPLTGVVLQTDERNFYRTVQISAGNDTARMTVVGRDVMYRYDTPRFADERLSLHFGPVPARYLQLVVYNHDDQPVHLNVQHVIALEYSVVVKGTASELRLYFGNKSVHAPLYDIGRTLQYVDLQAALPLSPGQLTANPEYAPVDDRPWTERHPVLLWVMFGLVFVVLGFLVLHMARKGNPSPPAP